MLDLNPFVKIAWNSNLFKAKWSDEVNAMQTLTFEAEYQMVKQGFRDANVYHMHPQHFDAQIARITNDGLTFLPILRSKMYSGFSHKHFPVETLDLNSFVYGVVARDLKTAQSFVQASKQGNHQEIGRLLGYPKCCCKTFQENWETKKILDPCYEAALNSNQNTIDEAGVHVNVDPLINPMLRYFGIKIIPFFPCSFSCKEAVDIGKKWFALMTSLDSKTAMGIKDILEQPISWSLHKGIVYIKTPLFKGIVNGYDCANTKNIIANEIAEQKEVD